MRRQHRTTRKEHHDDPTTLWRQLSENRITKKASTSRKNAQKQSWMLGLLSERVVCVVRFFCRFYLLLVVHGCYEMQHGCQWPLLCGRGCAFTRGVLGRCRVAVFIRVWEGSSEHKGKRSGGGWFWQQLVCGENYR